MTGRGRVFFRTGIEDAIDIGIDNSGRGVIKRGGQLVINLLSELGCRIGKNHPAMQRDILTYRLRAG